MTQEFYRGGTRSAFSTQFNGGDFTTDGTGLAVIPVVTASPGSILRLKRVQCTIMIPKQSTNKVGWYAFIRVPNDFTAQYGDLSVADPTVLRARGVMTNPDHAVYSENFLAAINLDGGGLLAILVNLNGTVSAPKPSFTLRWTEERQLG